jgi:tRNA G46 methylase TrmB
VQKHSRPVSSTQHRPHERLPELLQRHRDRPWRAPLARHNIAAIERLEQYLLHNSLPLILDSFCGTGHSTAELAGHHAGHLIVGIDKSGHRLRRHPGAASDNYLLLQADCEAIWQYLVERGIRIDYHYLLYPNPWPKPGHLQRRIHGHPAFPLLLRLGGRVELRSNWQLYVEEFGLAMQLSGIPGLVRRIEVSSPLSLFERKYQQSGHSLWSFCAKLPM